MIMMTEGMRFIREGWEYPDIETETWKLKPDAPEWAKREFEEFYKKIYPEPDENGVITLA
jgi:hypothetical protein